MLQIVFESSVVLDGTKTTDEPVGQVHEFESSVVLDGTKTFISGSGYRLSFESSVVLDGTKTNRFSIDV